MVFSANTDGESTTAKVSPLATGYLIRRFIIWFISIFSIFTTKNPCHFQAVKFTDRRCGSPLGSSNNTAYLREHVFGKLPNSAFTSSTGASPWFAKRSNPFSYLPFQTIDYCLIYILFGSKGREALGPLGMVRPLNWLPNVDHRHLSGPCDRFKSCNPRWCSRIRYEVCYRLFRKNNILVYLLFCAS